MKRCCDMEAVIDAYVEEITGLAVSGVIGAEDAIKDVALFITTYTKFHEENKIRHMMMFTEDHEKMDEEFGMAYIGNDETGSWKMVFVTGDNKRMKFILE